jgi:hypothetical protein
MSFLARRAALHPGPPAGVHGPWAGRRPRRPLARARGQRAAAFALEGPGAALAFDKPLVLVGSAEDADVRLSGPGGERRGAAAPRGAPCRRGTPCREGLASQAGADAVCSLMCRLSRAASACGPPPLACRANGRQRHADPGEHRVRPRCAAASPAPPTTPHHPLRPPPVAPRHAQLTQKGKQLFLSALVGEDVFDATNTFIDGDEARPRVSYVLAAGSTLAFGGSGGGGGASFVVRFEEPTGSNPLVEMLMRGVTAGASPDVRRALEEGGGAAGAP